MRCGPPTGLVWGEADCAVKLDSDEVVINAPRTALERFGESGSA